MKTLFLFIAIFTLLKSYSQITIYGSIQNEEGEALVGASIFEVNQEKGTPSRESGRFFIELKKQDIHLRISYIGYETREIHLSKNELKRNFELNITLQTKIEEINTIDVTASPVKKVISEDNLLILDFEFLDDRLLLLQKSPDKGYFIEIKDEYEKYGYRQQLNFKPKKLELDCFGNIQILGKDSVYQFAFMEQKFHQIDQVAIPIYQKNIQACKAQNTFYFVFQSHGEHGKSAQYTFFPKDTNQEIITHEIVDLDAWKVAAQYYVEILALYNASVSYGDNIIMGGIWDGDIKKLNESPKLNQMIIFYDKILAQPLYSPIFNLNDELILFDHTNNRILYPLKNKTTPIAYHQSKKWLNLILLDPQKNEFITFFKKNGLFTAHTIDIATGKLKKGTILEENAYPENLKINNGYVYYLFKDPNDFYGNVLLKQKID